MKPYQIISNRSFEDWPSFQLVYQWEDIFSRELNIPIKNLSKIYSSSKIIRLLYPIADILFSKPTLQFQISALSFNTVFNSRNVIPYVIDFWIPKEMICHFDRAYSRCPIVLISSKEVFDFLKENGSRTNIAHLPLSIPDESIPKSLEFEKKYDVAILGRTSPVLKGFFERYCISHPDTTYIYREINGGVFSFYNSKGELLIASRSQDVYLDFLRKSKCVFYSTPGIDGDRTDTNGFSPVTPRFFESLSCGCNIVMRYKLNSDVKYYGLPEHWENASDYQTFERLLEAALSQPIDKDLYQEYMINNSTTRRVTSFKEYFNL